VRPEKVSGRSTLSISGWCGAIMLGVFVVLGLVGPLVAPDHPGHIDLANRFAPMSAEHWFGTDSKGADALSQLLYGAREALSISAIVVAITASIGLVAGTVAGWFRGVVDEVIMRIVDILMAFPGILANIAIVATVKDPGLGVMIAALCVNGWVGYARVARGQVLALREREFVTAAVALGASNRRVVFRHLIPNLLGPALVQMTFGFGGVILVVAALAFLGIGPQIDYTWGAMLDQARTFLWRTGFTHYALVPGIAIMWVVIGANLLGDGLRDRLDPKQRGKA